MTARSNSFITRIQKHKLNGNDSAKSTYESAIINTEQQSKPVSLLLLSPALKFKDEDEDEALGGVQLASVACTLALIRFWCGLDWS
jgi:hypothetical protein